MEEVPTWMLKSPSMLLGGGNVERRAASQVMLVSGDIASDRETWKSAVLKGGVGGG